MTDAARTIPVTGATDGAGLEATRALAGNEASLWANRDRLPEWRSPDDGFPLISLGADAATGRKSVRMARPWPAPLWPLAPRSGRARFERPGTE